MIEPKKRKAPEFATRWDEQWARQRNNLAKFRWANKDRWPSILEEFPKGNHLGQWVLRQRDLHARALLSQERTRELSKLGFDWEKTDEREAHWDRQFGYLKEFRKRSPKRWPLAREEYPKGNRLGLWVWRQRQNASEKTLDKARKDALLAIGFPLVLPDSWETHYQTLKAYRAKNPKRWPKAREEFPAGERLGLWCHLQRCSHKMGTLRKDRVAKLDKIGFLWSVKDLGWSKRYEQLKEYQKKNPDKWPSLDASALQDRRLISWCSTQRHKRKVRKLDKDKIAMLTKIGFRW